MTNRPTMEQESIVEKMERLMASQNVTDVPKTAGLVAKIVSSLDTAAAAAAAELAKTSTVRQKSISPESGNRNKQQQQQSTNRSRRDSNASHSSMGSSYTSDEEDSDEDDDIDSISPRFRQPRPINTKKQSDFCVRDIRDAEFGRREIEYAERGMPGIMALRESAKDDQPLKGARVMGCTHINAQTAVCIDCFVFNRFFLL